MTQRLHSMMMLSAGPRWGWLLLGAACALAVGCSPRAAGSSKAQTRTVSYPAIKASADAMLPAIQRRVQDMARLGPRQTGQEGCQRTLDYVRQAISQAAPNVPVEEFTTTVTVAQDRTRPEQLDLTRSGDQVFSHIVLSSGGGTVELPAYAFRPNSAQACQTHDPGRCLLEPAAQSVRSSAPTPPTSPAQPGALPCPHCERPRRLVDLGSGTWDDFASKGKDLSDAVAVLDFNSGDAWLRAVSLGAYGVVFLAPRETTLFQADDKFLLTLPMHVVRLYVSGPAAEAVRQAAADPTARLTLSSRLAYANVPAKVLSLTIPGQDRSYSLALAAHCDARSIVPDLAYGAAELWGPAELLSLVEHYAQPGNRPACDLRIYFTTGHWQSQQAMRDYLAPERPTFEQIGRHIRIVMGVDMVPEGNSLNLLPESSWDFESNTAYKWLSQRLFTRDGWRDRMLAGLDLAGKAQLFAGGRPIMSETLDSPMADRNNRSPMVFTPRFPTAEQPWQAFGVTTFAFQTSRLTRLRHNTPLDQWAAIDPAQVRATLGPQLAMTLGVLEHLQAFPRGLMPRLAPRLHQSADWGGFARLSGRIIEWDRAIGWFAERLPGHSSVQEAATAPAATSRPAGIQTLVQAFPCDSIMNKWVGSRVRNFLPRPQIPARVQTRELQSFMFQDLRLLEQPQFQINGIYAAYPETQYNVLAYSVDSAGRVRHATDFGAHGDGNKAFQCTEVDVDDSNVDLPVSLFECGTIELFDLTDPQRYNPGVAAYGSYIQLYVSKSDYADGGCSPVLRVNAVKDTQSHTDLERWGFAQYGPTAMVFLPADSSIASTTRPAGLGTLDAEILLGGWFTNFGVLNNPDPAGRPRGYRVAAGQTLRLSDAKAPTPARAVDQLATLDELRLRNFGQYDVSSPLANSYHAATTQSVRRAQEARAAGDPELARAHDLTAWTSETLAYRNTMSLLVDVVSTTVLYFVLLIPFSFLLERLVLPQRTPLRTAIVATAIFAVFAGLLYSFHPGFKLASNVLVTTTAFIIVVMTLPALVLLLVRGVAMLRAIGSKAIITQRSEAESAGVITASLSLAVSNMRRRKLRTGLTLATITTLVLALVLLTTSSAFDFKIPEPGGLGSATFEGIQLYNSTDRRQALLKEMVEIYEPLLAQGVDLPGRPQPVRALVLRREVANYGYDHKTANGTLYFEANGKRTRVPYFQVMDWRDNLVDYVAPPDAPLPKSAPVRTGPDGLRHVRLSDILIEGAFLAPGDTDVVVLPSNMADELGVSVGDKITVMGMPLTVKGIWQSQLSLPGQAVKLPGSMDRLNDLDGLPMTALRLSSFREGEPDTPMHAPSSEVAIVPRAWIQKQGVFPSVVSSLVVIPRSGEVNAPLSESPPDRDAIGPLSERLAKDILNVDVFSHALDAEGHSVSQRVSMRTATHIQGSSMMMVILVVAVLMILAIMTGTVYERMREIHIFSSVGLSPRHVAGMFLIEALVYAGIASVLGYFLGIISLRVLLDHLKATGQQADFYPNYLGVFVLYSIGIAVLGTLASSLYPIRLASKMVNPSAGKSWQLGNDQDEDHWHIRLPFIATTWGEAQAMMVYAAEYLAMYQGERSGRFVCEKPPAGRRVGHKLNLSMPIWLAPFERNLSQQTVLTIAPAAQDAPLAQTDGSANPAAGPPGEHWWEMTLDLRRLSGPGYLWQRGARVFVDMMCKHLLRWRAASAQQEAECLARSGDLYPAPGHEAAHAAGHGEPEAAT